MIMSNPWFFQKGWFFVDSPWCFNFDEDGPRHEPDRSCLSQFGWESRSRREPTRSDEVVKGSPWSNFGGWKGWLPILFGHLHVLFSSDREISAGEHWSASHNWWFWWWPPEECVGLRPINNQYEWLGMVSSKTIYSYHSGVTFWGS